MASALKALVKATGCKPESDEARQEYLTRLVKAVLDLSEDDWAQLPDADQDWVNEGVMAIKAKKSIVDPDAADEDEEEEEAPKAKKGKKAAKKAVVEEDEEDVVEDAPPAKKKPVPPKRESAGPTCYSTAFAIMCKNPSTTFDALRKKLEAKNLYSSASARTVHGTIQKAVKLLRENGLMKD